MILYFLSVFDYISNYYENLKITAMHFKQMI